MLTVALAGPMAEAKVPRNRATVMLVIDVSLSMQATDVEPSRLAAAQAAAKAFADQLTPGINLGLVSFAGTAAVLVSPTADREPVKRAIDGLQLSESTATGEAIFAAMQSMETFSQAIAGGRRGPAAGADRADERRQADRARRVTREKEPRGVVHRGPGGGGGRDPGLDDLVRHRVRLDRDRPGERTPVAVDDASMRQIAELSGGQFFTAASEDELRQVYAELGEQIGYEIRRVDTSRPWLAGGTLLLVVGVGTGIALGRRLP